MNPTMMKLLGDARAQELSYDLSRDLRRRGFGTVRRHRSLRRADRIRL